ncbi:MAG: pilus assembly protein PilP [Deltaproteobacteria bacterium]
MMRKITGMIILLPFVLVGCGGKEEPQTEQLKAAPQVAVQKQEAPIQAPREASTVEKERRNPFASYLAKQIEKPARERTPLECCDLMTFKVSAVVVSPTGNYALLQASDGKRYIVKKGDRIGLKDGSIVHIGKDVLVVEEIEKDQDDKILARPRTELALPKIK